jgi:hypothetical protein
MKKYRVRLNGQNFNMGAGNILGFYTTRWVKAEDPESAKKVAISLIINDDSFIYTIQNDKNDPPKIFLDDLTEVGWFEFLIKKPGRGYTFYPDDN